MAAVQNLKISRKQIDLHHEIACGRFAIIFLAKYKNEGEYKTIVVKTVKDHNKGSILKMKTKINFYASKIRPHKNILHFIGSVEDKVRGPMMLLEYCENGNLKDFLEQMKTKATGDLNERLHRIVFDICLGMEFLAENKVTHRRLAARNILLNKLLEPKIAGFGPDPAFHNEHLGPEQIPIKWMAPECMMSTEHANELSDVWSFGVVMWEIFSFGDTPYPEHQSREILHKVKQGHRMKKPEYCDEAYYEVMKKCWKYEPKDRPRFTSLKRDLSDVHFH